MSPHPLADHFARIIATLVRMLGDRLERPGKPGLAGPLTLAIHIRLTGIRNRLARYVARFQAGTLTPPRPRRRPAAPRPRSTGPGRWDHLPKLPRGRLWLVRLVPGSGVGVNYLKILLDAPEMRAMLEAAPQIGRTLRPFWHMVSGDPLPPLLQPPGPAPRPPRPRRPAEVPAAPHAGLAPSARPIARSAPPAPRRAGHPLRPPDRGSA